MTIFNETRSQLCTRILKHHWILLSNTAEVINTVCFVPLFCPYSFYRILSLWGDLNSSWALQDLLSDQGGFYSSELIVIILTYKCFLLPFSAMKMEIFLICWIKILARTSGPFCMLLDPSPARLWAYRLFLMPSIIEVWKGRGRFFLIFAPAFFLLIFWGCLCWN